MLKKSMNSFTGWKYVIHFVTSMILQYKRRKNTDIDAGWSLYTPGRASQVLIG